MAWNLSGSSLPLTWKWRPPRCHTYIAISDKLDAMELSRLKTVNTIWKQNKDFQWGDLKFSANIAVDAVPNHTNLANQHTQQRMTIAKDVGTGNLDTTVDKMRPQTRDLNTKEENTRRLMRTSIMMRSVFLHVLQTLHKEMTNHQTCDVWWLNRLNWSLYNCPCDAQVQGWHQCRW